MKVKVIGAGLAGSEAAWQLANRGIEVELYEMRPVKKSGYWNLFRFNPALKAEGKNPFTLDSKEPNAEYQAFIKNEARYTRLMREFPDRAEALFQKSEKVALDRYAHLLKLKDLYAPDAE